MNRKLVRVLSLSVLAMIPFAFGVANAQLEVEDPAENNVSVSERVEIVRNDTLVTDVAEDVIKNTEVDSSDNVNQADNKTKSEDNVQTDKASEKELKLQYVNGILRITDNNGNFYKGMYKIGEYNYCADENAKVIVDKFFVYDGRAYISDVNGRICTGIVYSNQYGYYYYCNPEESGAIKTGAGFVEWNDHRYYINRGGKIATGGFTVINGSAYIIGNDGAIQTGVIYSNQYGYYYYCDPEKGGVIKTGAGFVEWNGNRYYVNRGGKIATNGFTVIEGYAYIIDKNGAIKTGVVYSKQYGYCYYCDPEKGGAIKTDAGYVEWNGKQYYVNKGGKINPTVEFKAIALLDEIGYSIYNAYKYLAKQPYYRMYVSTSYGKEWFAEFGFTNAKGNCYVKTAMLYYMMKAMGYDNIRAVDGFCEGWGGERLPHGWIEYYENGKTYIIDPTFENEVGRNGYMIQYGQKGTWRYLPNESRTWTE